MNSLASQAMPFLQMLWRQKWIAVGIAWLVCTVGWIGVAFMPTKYKSSTRIYLNADPLLTPLLRGLAIDTDPSRHLDFLQRTLLSRPNLEQLVRLTDLDIHIKSPAERETLFRRLAAEVSITPITSNLMTISYRNKDPQTAKNVVQGLLTIFAEKTAGSSRSEMDSAQRFLDDEIASYRDQLRAKDQQRAVLARQYPDLVSTEGPIGGEARSRLDQERSAIVRIKNELEDAVTNRNSLLKELSSVPPMLSVDRAPQVVVNGGRSLSPDEQRLAQMQNNLDAMRLKYTDQHPDVIATRQEIKQLEAEMKHSGSESSGGVSKTQIPNAVYDQLKVKLVDAETQVAAIQRRLKQAQAEEERIEKIARSAPAVLNEVQDLDRDYGILKRNYEEFVSRRQSDTNCRSRRHEDREDSVPGYRCAASAAGTGRAQSAAAGFDGSSRRSRHWPSDTLDDRAARSLLRDGCATSRPWNPDFGKRHADFDWRRATTGHGPVSGSVRQRGCSDSRLWNLAAVELETAFDGRFLMVELIGLIERAAALLRQRESAQLAPSPPVR